MVPEERQFARTTYKHTRELRNEVKVVKFSERFTAVRQDYVDACFEQIFDFWTHSKGRMNDKYPKVRLARKLTLRMPTKSVYDSNN